MGHRMPPLSEMLLHLALRYPVKIVCDLGGPYTEQDERYIKIVEKLHKEKQP